MIDAEWVRKTLPLDDAGDVLLAHYIVPQDHIEDHPGVEVHQAIPVAGFLALFGATDGSYDQLVALDDEYAMGYRGHLDDWKAAGLIS